MMWSKGSKSIIKSMENQNAWHQGMKDYCNLNRNRETLSKPKQSQAMGKSPGLLIGKCKTFVPPLLLDVNQALLN